MSDVNFKKNNNSLSNFLVITNVLSARLFIESEKLAQAVDEFSKQLRVCAKAWGDKNNIHSRVNAEFGAHVTLRNSRFSVQTFFST